MPMVYNEDTGQMEFVSDGIYSGPASQGNSIQGDFGDDPNNALRARGYLPYSGWTGSQVPWEYTSGAGGQQFGSEMDYLNWLYGPGGTLTDYNGEQFYQTPNGVDAYLPGRTPMEINRPDSALGQLTLGGLLALGGVGLTGMLPGTESVFSGIGASGASGAPALGELGSGAFNLGSGGASGISATGGILGSGAAGVPGAASVFPAADALALGATGAAGGLTGPISFSDVAQIGQLGSGTSGGVPTGVSTTGGTLGSGTAGVPGAGSAPWGVNPASTAATSGSAISRILDGTATTSDWASVLGNVGATGLGLAGANSQANAFGDIAQQYLDMGKPYRDLLQQSYSPNFSMANQPDFMNALNIGADAAARATSAKVGNPVDNPGAYAEMQKYISGSLALPQLNTYRSQLGTFGQMGTNQAGTAQMGEAQSQGGMYNALGYGLGQLTQPDNPFKGLLDQFKPQNLNSGRYF